MDVYVWFNPEDAKYKIGSRIDYELLVRRKGSDQDIRLLYKFNRLSSKIAEQVVNELNEPDDQIKLYA